MTLIHVLLFYFPACHQLYFTLCKHAYFISTQHRSIIELCSCSNSNVQWETQDTPITALSAAVATNTSLLLGIWASGTDSIDNELNALEAALEEHGSDLADLVVGISVGSEDLYRASKSGERNDAGIGNGPDTIVRFIREARARLNNTALADKPYTHVDAWDAWVNSSNAAVVDEVDFVSVNIFPFYVDPVDNSIENAAAIFNGALTATERAVRDKDVWITETGWPYSGPAWANAEVSCDYTRHMEDMY